MLGPLTVVESEEGLDENTLGTFNMHTRIITVRPGLHESQRDQVLNHEWIHAVLWDTGLYNGLAPEVEEQICDAIATAIVASTL